MKSANKANWGVLLLTSNFPPVRGGSASVYANLARRLGTRLIVLAPERDYADGLPLIGWREHDRNSPNRIVRIPLLRTILRPQVYRGKWPRRIWDLAIRLSVAKKVASAIIHDRVRTVCIGELLASGWIAPILRWVPGVKTLIYVHGEEITTNDPYFPIRARAKRHLIASDGVIVVSKFTLSVTSLLMGSGSERKITLIQNGVDTERFFPGEKSSDLMAVYGLHQKFVFVSVCRLVEKKGLDNALRAFSLITESFPETRFLLVGSGPYEYALHAITRDLRLADRVIFAGPISERDLVAHYRLGDVFVMPNRALPDGDTEGFGLVFLEANSCGLPVIAGRDGGSVEAVEDGYNGLVVDGRSVEQIAGAMQALLCDAELRDKLRANGLQRAKESGWDTRASTFVGVCL